jgi:hypothetical protein
VASRSVISLPCSSEAIAIRTSISSVVHADFRFSPAGWIGMEMITNP